MKKHICKVCGTDKKVEFHWVAHSPDTFTPLCVHHHKEEHRKDPSLNIQFPDYEKTTITLRRGTKVRLEKVGVFNEDWELLLNRIMDEFEEYQEVKKTWQGKIVSR